MFPCFWVAAQSRDEYRHYSTADGLSNNKISSILQDNYGFIWIGTANGLNRFDGYNFIQYKNKIGDTTSITNNCIQSLCLDSKGYIWAATNNGLNRYDAKTETFTHFRHRDNDSTSIANNLVSFVYEDEEGYIWAGAGQILDRLDPATGVFTHYSMPPVAVTDETRIIGGIIAYNNDLFVSVWGVGVYRLNRNTRRFIPVSAVHKIPKTQSWFNNFYIDKKGNLLATDGIFMRYNPDTNSFYPVSADIEGPSPLSIDCIGEVGPDKYITGTTGNGFNVYNSNFGFESSHLLDPDSSLTANNSLITLLVAKSGEVWFGMTVNGLFKWERNKKKFNAYKHVPGNTNSIAAGPVSSISFSKSGQVWLGSRVNGITVYDTRSQRFSHITQQAKGLNSSYVETIFEDRKGNKWIGTWGGGLNKIEAGTGAFTYFEKGRNDTGFLPDNFVTDICQSPDGRVWVSTTRGVSVIDASLKKEKVKSFVYKPGSNASPSGLRVDALLCDHDGIIWMGTAANGISRYHPATNRFDYFDYDFNSRQSLGSNKINTLFEDSKKRIWVGCSGGGLNLFVPGTKSFIRYDEEDGLPGNEIKGIAEDDNGILWISTDKGLSRFDTERNGFKNYYAKNDVFSNRFYTQAIRKSPADGKIFAGTEDGLITFYPDSIINNSFIPPVYINSFKIYGTAGEQTTASYISGIQHLKSVKIAYNENTFTIGFLSLNYSNSGKNKYAYRLEGETNDWVALGATRELTFSDLPPGRYKLHIKGSNDDLVWNEIGTTLEIIILPPWWLSWWAYTCYALAAAGLVFWFIRARINRGIKKIMEIEALRTKISSDLHDDVGSILSGLAMQGQLLAMEAKDEMKVQLNDISNMSRDAMEHMRDTVWAMDSNKDKYENLIDRMRAFAEKNMAMKHLTHEFVITNIDTKKFIRPEQRQAIYLIFKEAVTNIIRHCDGTHVRITFAYLKNSLHLTIHDNGAEKQCFNTDGSGLSNMKMRAVKIGGRLDTRYENGFVVMLQIP